MTTVSISTSVYVDVDVDIDLEEIDTDDLLTELGRREVDLGNGIDPDRLERLGNDLYYALLYDRNDKALKAAKLVAEEITGRIVS